MTKRTRCGGEWTEAQYRAFIKSVLRTGSIKYPAKHKVKEAAKRKKPQGNPGRHRFEFKCAACKQYHPNKDVHVDHIIPVGELVLERAGEHIERLFCEPEGMQILCVPCHKKKTAAEATARAAARRKK